MGQEIDHSNFSESDFERFYSILESETKLLWTLLREKRCSQKGPVAGFEIETWLVDTDMSPTPVNIEFLEAFNNPLATPELAKFNVELNNHPVKLTSRALNELHKDLDHLFGEATDTAESLGSHLLMIGTLPTLRQSALNLSNMSTLNRFRALNEQILKSGRIPIHLDIEGKQHLQCDHFDVMLESAATSFQIHIQTPLEQAHRIYNASIMASAPVVAVSANSPFLFGLDLWAETRIPLFEQSIKIGGYDHKVQSPLLRVSFGSGYVRKSIFECFEENLEHFPVLLPTHLASNPDELSYLRLHNGTIWRWNRPLIGFDTDGTPHIRIEHRVIPSGPTVVDMMANAAFYYGLATALATDSADPESLIPFSEAQTNFYQACRDGMNAHISWIGGRESSIQSLVLNKLLGKAENGLSILGIAEQDADFYLNIIRQRVESGLNGCEWQRGFVRENNADLKTMTEVYLKNQNSGKPVHTWKTR